MPGAPDRFVLDTSALFCLLQNEAGAEQVDHILKTNGPGDRVFVSFISLMEYCYKLQRDFGEGIARRAYLQLKQLPLQVIESDEQLGLSAAAIKATHKLSVADAWIAATALRLGATLVHKDPEFESLKNDMSLQPLPYKQRL